MASTAPDRPSRPVRPRPRYWLRRLLLALLLAVPVIAWRGFRSIEQSVPITPEAEAPRVVASQPVYVAIMGVDERRDDRGRADTLMLVRLSADSDAATIINIPRDTRVELPNGEPIKLNSVYAREGPELVAQMLSELLDLPKPYYVKLNLQSFEKIIDQLGGVTLTVDRNYFYEDPYQDLYIDIKAGKQVMDGETALKFVRVRYDGITNDDLGRIKRQQQFLDAVRQKLSSPAYWVQIPGMVGTLRKYIATNIPEADQLQLAESLFKARSNLEMLTLPGMPDDSNGDWLLNREAWSEITVRWNQKP